MHAGACSYSYGTSSLAASVTYVKINDTVIATLAVYFKLKIHLSSNTIITSRLSMPRGSQPIKIAYEIKDFWISIGISGFFSQDFKISVKISRFQSR